MRAREVEVASLRAQLGAAVAEREAAVEAAAAAVAAQWQAKVKEAQVGVGRTTPWPTSNSRFP